MKLAIDIGLRNLAMCIMNGENVSDLSTYKIHLWEVFNLLEDDNKFCESLQKNKKVCGHKANFKYSQENSTIFSCKKHIPKNTPSTPYKKKLVSDMILQDIAKLVINKIQEIYNDFKEIFSALTDILIELQPKINQKMKFISHILFAKLTDLFKDSKTVIRFVGASKKLKAYTGPEITCQLKGAYAKRKWLSIEYTKWFLTNKFNKQEGEKWLKFLEENKTKNDDLCDTNLMAINAIYGLPKKSPKNTKKVKKLLKNVKES
jgi:hypothetical protein